MRIITLFIWFISISAPLYALDNIILHTGEILTGVELLKTSKYTVLQSEGRFLLLDQKDIKRCENPDPHINAPIPYSNGISAHIVFKNKVSIEGEILTETGDLLVVRTAELITTEFDNKVYVLAKSSISEISYLLPDNKADQLIIFTQAYNAIVSTKDSQLIPRYGAHLNLPLTFNAGSTSGLEVVIFSGVSFRLEPKSSAFVTWSKERGYIVTLQSGSIYIDGSSSSALVMVATAKGMCGGQSACFKVTETDSLVQVLIHSGSVSMQPLSGGAVEIIMHDPRDKAVFTGLPGSVLLEQCLATTFELSDLADRIACLNMRENHYFEASPQNYKDTLWGSRGRWWLGIGTLSLLMVTYSVVYLIGH